jgi:hypothetical protein
LEIDEEEMQDVREYVVRLNMKSMLAKVTYEFKCKQNEAQSIDD